MPWTLVVHWPLAQLSLRRTGQSHGGPDRQPGTRGDHRAEAAQETRQLLATQSRVLSLPRSLSPKFYRLPILHIPSAPDLPLHRSTHATSFYNIVHRSSLNLLVLQRSTPSTAFYFYRVPFVLPRAFHPSTPFYRDNSTQAPQTRTSAAVAWPSCYDSNLRSTSSRWPLQRV